MARRPGTAAASAARRVLYHSLNAASRSRAMVALTTKSARVGVRSCITTLRPTRGDQNSPCNVVMQDLTPLPADLARVLAGLGRRAADLRARAVERQRQGDQLEVVAGH